MFSVQFTCRVGSRNEMELYDFVFDYRRIKKITEFDAEPLTFHERSLQ